MDDRVNKLGQLAVIVVGFFATIQLLVTTVAAGTAPLTRALVTVAFAVACAVRYWWVVLLLPWPFRPFRIVALLAAWCALPVVAVETPDARRWAYALAALSAIGCVTEVYNGITGQWRVGSEAMTRSLKQDHVTGAAAAAVAAVILVSAGRALAPPALDWLVLAMVAADWIRLLLMIRRHRSFLTTDATL